jgi:hypothetical protein
MEKKNLLNEISIDKAYIDFYQKKNISKNDFDNAMNLIQNLIDNNEKYNGSYCKSYKTLKYSKSSIELAFRYLLDCIIFDENSPIFNDKNFNNNLKELNTSMLLTYLDVDFDEIPKNRIEQVKFISDKKIDIGKNQFKITKLISWRNKEQWLHFADAFGIESNLGKLCLQKSESL